MADNSIQADANEVLLHPDALRCLQKKQLASLCIRLDLKAIGKKDELIARLEGYNKGISGSPDTPSKGRVVQARPRLRSISMASIDTLDNKENEGDELELASGASIKLISSDKGAEVEAVHSTSRKSILRDQISNVVPDVAEPAIPSSSTKSIYPWKRMSSASSLKIAPNVFEADDSTSKAAPMASSDDTMTLDECGKGNAAPEENKGSLGNLKKWLSRSASSSGAKSIIIKASDAKPLAPASATVSSPASKRKREDEEIESRPFYMCDMVEVPVTRIIKPRPSRAVKASRLSPETAKASDAASKVLDEMNARLQQSGKSTATQLPSQGAWSVNLKPPASPLKSVNSRTKGRFSGEHAKHFKKMDSIASHYAASRIAAANQEWRCASSGSNSSSRHVASPAKKLKIAEPTEEQIAKTTEHRAAIQKKLEMSRQRRKRTTKPGLRSRFTGAVRGFVGAAVGLTNTSGHMSTTASIPAQKVQPRKPSPSPVNPASPNKAPTPKPVFDLKASLAKKPTGYKPYSAKETVQLLQAAASPSKVSTAPLAAPSPIRNGWTVIKTTTAPIIPPRVASNKTASSPIAFPSVSPTRNSPSDLASEVQAAPSIVRRPSAHITAARKTRSSMSNARRGPLQAEKLKRAAKINDRKHQASMVARQKTQSAVRRAVQKGEKVVAEIDSGVGRGTPRKASARVLMDGAGRGQAAVKRVS